MPKVVSVEFKKLGKSYYFDPNGLHLELGDEVIVDTVSGEDFATVVGSTVDVEPESIHKALKKIIRRATPDDKVRQDENSRLQIEAKRIAQQKADSYRLDMRIADANVAFDGSKITLSFTAESRIDFRQLVKEIAAVFQRRIELRQVGIRDKARMMGGMGTCGQRLCCTVFSGDLDPVSIRMAKDQDLPLNPQKISGCCGRLMCCLRYEVEAYRDFKKRAPRCGRMIETTSGLSGKVVGLDTVREKITIRDAQGKISTVPLSDVTKSTS